MIVAVLFAKYPLSVDVSTIRGCAALPTGSAPLPQPRSDLTLTGGCGSAARRTSIKASRASLEVPMSLPVGERWKLRRIERAMASAEPGLAARLSIFNQLGRQEEMPSTERVKARTIRRQKWVERAITAYLISGQDTLLLALELFSAACLRLAAGCAACDPARTVSGYAAVADPAARSRGPAAVWAG